MFSDLSDTAPLTPHGHCLQWNPAPAGLMAGCDALIALACLFISGALIHFAAKRPKIERKTPLLPFAAFILACGLTHAFGAATIWIPAHYAHAAVKAATAIVAIFTAAYVAPIVSYLLTVPGAAELAQEIGDRKRQEDALREANRRMEVLLARNQESESRFRIMADAAPVLVWIADTGKLCTWFNKPWLNFTGRALEQEIGNGWAEGVHPDDFERCLDTYVSHFDRRQPFRMEYRIRRHDGQYRWLLDSGVPLFQEDRFSGYIGSCIDITDRKRAEQKLEEINESLERRIQDEIEKSRQKDLLIVQQARLAAMGEMIGNIAHQWRQPLNALGLTLGNIEDAAKRQDLTPEYLETLVRGGERIIEKMSATIDDFRHFFRPRKRPEPFSAAAAIDEALSLVSAAFRNNDIELHRDAEDDVQIVGFANEFSQALLNLLSNAKDAVLASRKTGGRVIVRLRKEEFHASVLVADNGGGIPAELKDKIFEPYFSTKDMGTGIGLYMSKMIVENSMHGTLSVRNTEIGAEFKLSLPIGPESSDPQTRTVARSA